MTRDGDEQQQVHEWVFARLSGDGILAAAMGVTLEALPGHLWPFVAPEDVEGRWVVYAAQAGIPSQPVGAYARLMVPVPLNVRCVGQQKDSGWMFPAFRRIHELLSGNHNHPGLDGAMILTGKRDSSLDYPEQAGGIRYRHVGGIYTVQVN